MATEQRTAFWFAALVLGLLAQVQPSNVHAATINNDACLSRSGQSGVDACAELAREFSDDVFALIAHGRTLERYGRPDSALEMYRVAMASHPDDRRVLQGLIRARANARAQRIILDITPQANDTSECWTARWMQAFRACQKELAERPDDPRLQERFGDVARSVGDVETAKAAYSRSLEIVADNDNLHHKRQALVQLMAGNTEAQKTPPVQPFEQTTPAAPRPSQPDQPATENSDTIRKLELLESLRASGLINADEYQNRRSDLLAAAFAGPDVATTTATRYRGLRSGRYIAVVIGNDRYQAFPELLTAAADARAMSEVLRSRYGFEVRTLIDADRHQIMSALSELRRTTTENDSVLLYYAGHGLLDEVADRGYWLPVDAERNNLAQWISTSDIAGVFAGAPAKHALVIADSCFAGTLLRSATGLETLERLAAKRSRTVLTSGGLEPVVDDGDGTHSVFAGALLDTLANNDTVLEASKLFAAVRDRVVLNAEQTPQYSPMQRAGHDGGDFLFIPKTVLDNHGTH